MKKIILILITSFGVLNGFAQQFPLQSQYQFNYSSINPAAVGEFDYYRIVGSFRNQWAGFNTQNNQAIATQYLTFTKGFGSNGLGLTFLNDNTGGAISTSGLKLSYSHKVLFNDNALLLGLSGGGTRMNLSPIDDPSFISNSDFVPEATFGAYFLIKDWKLGFSVPGILNANIDFTNSSENRIKSHVYTMISYSKKLNDDWSFYPSVLMKNTKNHQQIDANLNIKLRNLIWFGASYRTSPNESNQVQEAFGPSFYLGVDLGRLFAIYSHDISLGNMSSYPTHEITIGYDFIPVTEEELESRRNKEEEEEKVQDTDNDGVVDSLDLCPNLAGSAEANGCPDFDKDGIPDKYDLCPEIPGSFSAGCPDLTEVEKKIIQNVLNNLEFDAASDQLKRSSYSSLSQLAVLLIQNPVMFLEVHGFASSEGETTYNLKLSAMRSKSVEDFLLSKGVNRNSLITRFSGESSPIASNDSEFGRSKNRRVELSIRFHLKNNNQVTATENAYAEALRGINVLSDSDNYQPNTSERSDNKIIVEEEVEEIAIPEDNLNNNIQNINYEEEVVEEEVVEEEVVEEEVVEEIKSEEVPVEEVVEAPNEGKHILVVQVLNKENALRYINKSSEDLNYHQVGNRYYVYVYRSSYREDVVQYRTAYKNDSWIKTL